MTYVLAVLLAGVGVAAVAYADHDDSPGLGGLGLLLVAGAVFLAVRRARRRR